MRIIRKVRKEQHCGVRCARIEKKRRGKKGKRRKGRRREEKVGEGRRREEKRREEKRGREEREREDMGRKEEKRGEERRREEKRGERGEKRRKEMTSLCHMTSAEKLVHSLRSDRILSTRERWRGEIDLVHLFSLCSGPSKNAPFGS